MRCDLRKLLSFSVSFCFLICKMGRIMHLLLEWCEGQVRLCKWNISCSISHGRACLWMWVLLPSQLLEKTRVVFLGTIWLVTGYKYQVFWEVNQCLLRTVRKGKQKKDVSSLVTKVTFCERKSSVNCTHSIGLCVSSHFFLSAPSEENPPTQGPITY